MKKIVVVALAICSASVVSVRAMEKIKQPKLLINMSQASLNAPEEVHHKIIACVEPKDRNILRQVCLYLSTIASKDFAICRGRPRRERRKAFKWTVVG